jgi:integrase
MYTAVAKICGRRAKKMPDQTLSLHLAWCVQRNLRPVYIENRRRSIIQLEGELGKKAELADEIDYARWYQDVTDRMVPEARAVYLSHVRSYAQWLVSQGILDRDPTERLTRPRTKRRLPRPMNPAELSRAIDTAPPRIKPWLLLAAFEGLRAFEIAQLRVEDVDLSANMLIVENGKGGKQRLIPLHPLVREALEPLLRGKGYVFKHFSRQGPPTAHNVSHGLNRHLRLQGITATAHSARHWFLTEVYRESLDLRLTQELAGHASPNTTSGYAAWTPSKASPVVMGLSL